MTKKIYYGIDIGAPFAGFYGWRWDVDAKKITAYDKTMWETCIIDIKNDYMGESEVILGIEAPLWGSKAQFDYRKDSGKLVPESKWVPRFTKKWKGSLYEERLWFSGAGASTSVMAQILLGEISRDLAFDGVKKIKIYETYISGLQSVTNDQGIEKPEVLVISINGSIKASHAEDAFEALVMTYLEDMDLPSIDTSKLPEATLGKKRFRFSGKMKRAEKLDYQFEKKESFKLGLLETNPLFDLVENKILFTLRDLDAQVKKAAA